VLLMPRRRSAVAQVGRTKDKFHAVVPDARQPLHGSVLFSMTSLAGEPRGGGAPGEVQKVKVECNAYRHDKGLLPDAQGCVFASRLAL